MRILGISCLINALYFQVNIKLPTQNKEFNSATNYFIFEKSFLVYLCNLEILKLIATFVAKIHMPDLSRKNDTSFCL